MDGWLRMMQFHVNDAQKKQTKQATQITRECSQASACLQNHIHDVKS